MAGVHVSHTSKTAKSLEIGLLREAALTKAVWKIVSSRVIQLLTTNIPTIQIMNMKDLVVELAIAR